MFDQAERRSVRRWVAAALCLGASATAISGCDSKEEGAEAEAPTTAKRRCGDFIDEAEAKQLGLDGYRPNKGDTNPTRGVVCSTHPVVVTVHMADRWEDLVAGARGLKEMKESSGPTIGKTSLWFESPDTHQLMLLTSSGHYALGISGPDEAAVEKAARLAADGK